MNKNNETSNNEQKSTSLKRFELQLTPRLEEAKDNIGNYVCASSDAEVVRTSIRWANCLIKMITNPENPKSIVIRKTLEDGTTVDGELIIL